MPTESSPISFDVAIPEGWRGVDWPRNGVEFEVVLDDPIGFASRLSIERVEDLAPGDGEAGPMEQLIGERVVALTGTMTDGRLLDLQLHGAQPAEGEQPAFLATVAYLHGPHLVTAFIWAIPAGEGALVLTGLTDADMITLDVGAFGWIVDSLRIGGDAQPRTPAPVSPALRTRSELPVAPAGWTDVPFSDDRLLRQLVADRPGAAPAMIFVLTPLDVAGDAIERHQALLEDLGSTMTDADLQDVGPDQLAAGAALRSLVVFRQGEGSRTADVWTGTDDAPGLPAIWVVCDFDDDEARAEAVAWVRAATLQEFGA